MGAKLLLIRVSNVAIVKGLVAMKHGGAGRARKLRNIILVAGNSSPLEMGTNILDHKAPLVGVGILLGVVHECPSDVKAVIIGGHGCVGQNFVVLELVK